MGLGTPTLTPAHPFQPNPDPHKASHTHMSLLVLDLGASHLGTLQPQDGSLSLSILSWGVAPAPHGHHLLAWDLSLSSRGQAL